MANEIKQITSYQLKVCIEALKLAEVNEKNDSYFGSVLYDLLIEQNNN
jgi:hypothetical protein